MESVNRFLGILDKTDDFFVDPVGTNPERITRQALLELGFSVKHYKERSEFDKSNTIYEQYSFKRKRIDFALYSAKIAIEVDGDHWHANFTTKLTSTQVAAKLRDAQKEKSLHKHGWKLIRLREQDIINDIDKTRKYLYRNIIRLLDL